MDKFMVSKLFSRKKALDTESKQIKSLNLTEENFLATFDELMEQMDESWSTSRRSCYFLYTSS